MSGLTRVTRAAAMMGTLGHPVSQGVLLPGRGPRDTTTTTFLLLIGAQTTAMLVLLSRLGCCCWATPATRTWGIAPAMQPARR